MYAQRALMLYASGVELAAAGDARARDMFEQLGGIAQEVDVGGVKLAAPAAVLEAAGLTSELTPDPEEVTDEDIERAQASGLAEPQGYVARGIIADLADAVCAELEEIPAALVSLQAAALREREKERAAAVEVAAPLPSFASTQDEFRFGSRRVSVGY